MKTRVVTVFFLITAVSLSVLILPAGCRKGNQVIYKFGTFPDTAVNLSGLNSDYDDYNVDPDYRICQSFPTIFSSNRASEGGQFDLVAGQIEFNFDKFTGDFHIGSTMTNNPFLTKLINAANTSDNDFGPYRILSTEDSYEYLIITSGSEGNLDLRYLKYLPELNTANPDFGSLMPVTVLNSSSNDGYITFDVSQKRVFFCSDRDGQYDIYTVERTLGESLSEWFSLSPVAVTKPDSINSPYDDKCPIVYLNIMVFTSNRPSGMGGYDLYYSIYRKGVWGAPKNFGPGINTEYDEYRPVLGAHALFTNYFLIFSSNRPGGKGGFDLYFTGVNIEGRPELIEK